MLKILISSILCLIVSVVFSQTSPDEVLSDKLANRMKDSLNLSMQQKNKLKQINIDLNQEKRKAWKKYGRDSLGYYLQAIESKRDTLYYMALPRDKFVKYRQKKKNLITNN